MAKGPKRCWQCKRVLIKQKDGAVTCPKDCGPESLGNLLRLFFTSPSGGR